MTTDTAPHATPFFSVDATWLHMDEPTNRVTIVGLETFEKPLRFSRLRSVVEDRLLRFERFRQRVREPRLPLGLPTWEPDPHFDLDAHLWHIKLPPPGDWSALLQLAEKFMQVPLPADRPLWRMILIDHFGAGSAMFLCLSHAMADGAAILNVFNTLTGTTAKASLARLAPPKPAEQLDDDPAARIARVLDEASQMLEAPGNLWKKSLAAAQDPLGTVLRGADVGLSLGKLLFIPPDQRTALSGRCGPAKRAVACDPIPLAQVKSVAKTFGAKVNDVVLAAVAGSLRDYLQAHGEPVQGLNLRAVVPVYLNPWNDPTDLRNGFGLVFLSLPVGIADPLRRLRMLKRRMDYIKSTSEAAVAYGIMYGLGFTPPPVERMITRVFGLKGTAVMTNVIGPSEVRYLAGVPIKRMLFWVPQPAGLGMGVSLISYAGELSVMLATDARLVPDPEAMVAGFHREFDQLARLASAAASKGRAAAPRTRRAAGTGKNGAAHPRKNGAEAPVRRKARASAEARPPVSAPVSEEPQPQPPVSAAVFEEQPQPA